MPEAQTTRATDADTPAQQGQSTSDTKANSDGYTPPATQEEFDHILGERLRAERAKFADYDDLKAKAAKFDEAENASKSELQRLGEDRDTHKSRAEQAEAEALRLSVALTKQLSASQAKRLVGSTKEELEADADELLADIAASGKPTPPKPHPAQGRGENSTSGDWLRDQLTRT